MVLSSEKGRAQQQIVRVCNLFYLCTGIPIWYESGDYTYSSEHKPPEEPSEAYLHSAIQECLRWARANSAYLAPVSYTMPKGEIMLCYIITIKPLGAFFCGPMACESFEYWERFSQVEKNDGDMYRYWRSLPQIELQRIPAVQYILELLVKDSGSHLSRGISLPSAGLDQIAPLRLTKKEVTPHHSMPRQENLIRNALETGTIDHGLIASRIIKPLAKNDMLRSEKNRYIVNLIINSR
ncbi:MAG: hypothetical protein LBN21_03675, partial [Treponema sp.]|nr:hypothetical protein [Treponema sp.]